MASQYLTPATIVRLANLDLVARLVVEGFLSGQHKSPFFGFNVEFSEHRPYMPGDDIKHLDWKLWAKSDKYYIKQYEESTSLRCFVLLDVSKSMDFVSTQGPTATFKGADGEAQPLMSKLAYARFLSAALAYLMLHQKDAAGIVTFSDKIHQMVAPRTASSHLHLLLETLDRPSEGQKTDLGDVIQQVASRLHRRAMVVVVSDLLDDPDRVLKGLKYLKYLKHEPILFHVMAPDEIELPLDEMAHLEDMEDHTDLILDPRVLREDYKRRMREWLDRLRQECHFHKIDYHLFTTRDPLELALSEYLLKRQRS